MMPLDIGDNLIDRGSAAILLKYLAEATYKVKSRELAQRKLEISIDRLRKLSTKDIHKHIDELEDDIEDALEKARLIRTRQTEEDKTHKEINKRLKRIHERLGTYTGAQKQFSKKIETFDQEIDKKFETKETKLKKLEQDIKQLSKVYTAAKKSKKYTKKQLLAVGRRILKLHKEVKKLK